MGAIAYVAQRRLIAGARGAGLPRHGAPRDPGHRALHRAVQGLLAAAGPPLRDHLDHLRRLPDQVPADRLHGLPRRPPDGARRPRGRRAHPRRQPPGRLQGRDGAALRRGARLGVAPRVPPEPPRAVLLDPPLHDALPRRGRRHLHASTRRASGRPCPRWGSCCSGSPSSSWRWRSGSSAGASSRSDRRMAAVRLQALTKRFGEDVAAVRDLTLEIRHGELLSLLGPSGCGKTTTLRLIAGFLAPDAGEIWLGDRRLSSPRETVPPERRGMSMLFQSYAVWPHKTVAENVTYGLKFRTVPRADWPRRLREALALVRLEGFADRYPGELSGGQQQRVALARALVVEPAILLLDEPLSQPGRAPPRGDAVRDPARPRGLADHDGLRHPRPGRGDGHLRPHRRDERRPRSSRSARRPRSTSGRPRRSWRASSAGRTSSRGGLAAGGRVACEGGLELADGGRPGASARARRSRSRSGLTRSASRRRRARGPRRRQRRQRRTTAAERLHRHGHPGQLLRRRDGLPGGDRGDSAARSARRGRRSPASPWARPWSSGSRRDALHPRPMSR